MIPTVEMFTLIFLQCMYNQQLPLYLAVFIVRVNHSHAGFELLAHAQRVHKKGCMHIIQWHCIILI